MPWRNFDVAGSRTSSSRCITRTRFHCQSYSQYGHGVASFSANPRSGPNYHAAPARVSIRAEYLRPDMQSAAGQARTRNGGSEPLSNSNVNGFNNNPGSLTNGPFINNSSTNLNGNSSGTSNGHNKRLNNEQGVASAERELKQAQEIEVVLVREYGSLDKS